MIIIVVYIMKYDTSRKRNLIQFFKIIFIKEFSINNLYTRCTPLQLYSTMIFLLSIKVYTININIIVNSSI